MPFSRKEAMQRALLIFQVVVMVSGLFWCSVGTVSLSAIEPQQAEIGAEDSDATGGEIQLEPVFHGHQARITVPPLTGRGTFEASHSCRASQFTQDVLTPPPLY